MCCLSEVVKALAENLYNRLWVEVKGVEKKTGKRSGGDVPAVKATIISQAAQSMEGT